MTTFELRIKEGDGDWLTLATKEFDVLHEELVEGKSAGQDVEVAVWGIQPNEPALVDWDAALISSDQILHVGTKSNAGGLYPFANFNLPKDCAVLLAGRNVDPANWTDTTGLEGRSPDSIYLCEELGAEATLKLRLMDTTEGA